jgi:hypothetical protein|tara:strand:+ start:90 stop:719 length:630 start_codon:yes stop_codon:yes gene_type:complete
MLIKYVILKFIFFIIQISTSWKYHGVERFNKLVDSNRPVLVCVWHGFFIFPMVFLKNYYKQTKIVSSTHPDSMVLAKVLNDYGFNLIKGSSTRGAKNVIKEMMKSLRDTSSIIAITNDGPKGPARIAKGGAVSLAKKLNAKLVFISGKSDSCFRLKTWDRFVMPKPFSNNHVYINEINYPSDSNHEDIGKYISDKMNEIQDDIDAKKYN